MKIGTVEVSKVEQIFGDDADLIMTVERLGEEHESVNFGSGAVSDEVITDYDSWSVKDAAKVFRQAADWLDSLEPSKDADA